MAKVTYKSKLFKGNTMKQPIDARTAENIAFDVIDEINRFTSRGQSPVKGEGRFVGYKAQQVTGSQKKKRKSSEPKRGYPYNVMKYYPNKRARPVNLRLSGEMLASLDHTFDRPSQTIELGIFDPEQALKAETHNQGTQEPDVPRRPFLPTAEGEEFAESIRRKIVAIVKRRISYIIRATK